MAGHFPVPKQLEMLNAMWRPRWTWSPRYMMFTSYWPDPKSFIAYGTDGKSTLAVRGAWAVDLKPFFKLTAGMGITYVRLANYPTSEEIEVVPQDSDPTRFLPVSVSTNPSDPGSDPNHADGKAPISATLCITVPHWNAVARAFQRLVASPAEQPQAPSP